MNLKLKGVETSPDLFKSLFFYLPLPPRLPPNLPNARTPPPALGTPNEAP